MVYLDGDNNLDSDYFGVFNQLESAANNTNVNVVVAWDRSGNNNSAYFKVKYDPDLGQLANYVEGQDKWSKGELDMGHPSSLSDFVEWARTNYPVPHYVLFISNHGTGLKGIATDRTSASNWITVRGTRRCLGDGHVKWCQQD